MPSQDLILQERNFFSVLRVLDHRVDVPSQRRTDLLHGTTEHGRQFRSEALRRVPSRYYGSITGVGLVMSNRDPDVSRKIGVIGLGVGALAAYGERGDELLFYELDPSVIRIAEEGGLFSYLSDSEADIEIIEGDARISLEEALATTGSEQFDVLVVDAFSGDSIPIHLLTHEAFQLYRAHLAPGGLVVVHVSNRRLELTPLVLRLGASVGLEGYEIANASLRARLSSKSRWVVLAENPSTLEALKDFAERLVRDHSLGPTAIWINRMAPGALDAAPFWTDDYSDLFSVLK